MIDENWLTCIFSKQDFGETGVLFVEIPPPSVYFGFMMSDFGNIPTSDIINPKYIEGLF
jgi:hypothetical protein